MSQIPRAAAEAVARGLRDNGWQKTRHRLCWANSLLATRERHIREAETLLEAALPYLRNLLIKEIADEVSLSHDWQLDDPRYSYVEVQIDKDTYRQLCAAQESAEVSQSDNVGTETGG